MDLDLTSVKNMDPDPFKKCFKASKNDKKGSDPKSEDPDLFSKKVWIWIKLLKSFSQKKNRKI